MLSITYFIFILYNAGMSKIEKPPVTIDTIPEVYEYYVNNPVDERVTRFGYGAFSAIFRSHVSLWSEDAEQYIEDSLADGKQFILAANHLNTYDQFLLSSLTYKVPSLEPLIGNTFIPAKTDLFQNSWLRWMVEQLGAIPAYRGKDFKDRADPRRVISKDGLLDISTMRIDFGQNMGIYPEQTRNKHEPHRVQELRRGIGEIACMTIANKDLIILPVGNVVGTATPKQRKLPKKLDYIRSEFYDFRNSRHAYIHIGDPIEGPFESPQEVMDVLAPAMQASVDEALRRQEAAAS